MAKITSKYQVTVPKVIAEEYALHPGDNIEWIPAGDVIHVVPALRQSSPLDTESRLRLFDQATERHKRRERTRKVRPAKDRGWRREDLYNRGRSR